MSCGRHEEAIRSLACFLADKEGVKERRAESKTHREFGVQVSTAVDVQELVVGTVNDGDPRDSGRDLLGLFGRELMTPDCRILLR